MAEWLPLFPLQGVVLFPGTAVPLRIFEERYVRMVRDRLDGDRRFGVVLIREGEEVGGPATPMAVGCVAHIEDCREVEDGQFLLIAAGRERFRIVRTRRDSDLLLGLVEELNDTPDEADLSALAGDVIRCADGYFEIIRQLTRDMLGHIELPREPLSLSFLIAASLHVAPAQRQTLLEMTNTRERLEHERRLLVSEAANLTERIRVHEQASRIAATNGRLPDHHLRPPAGNQAE